MLNLSFENILKKHIEKLQQYIPVVEKVHGESNPEFYEVRKSFDAIIEEIKLGINLSSKLESEFEKIRKVTKNYTVPSNTCETYEAVYKMLEELDQAYHN